MPYKRRFKVVHDTVAVDEITPYQYNLTHKIGNKLVGTEVYPTAKEATISAYQLVERLLQSNIAAIQAAKDALQR